SSPGRNLPQEGEQAELRGQRRAMEERGGSALGESSSSRMANGTTGLSSGNTGLISPAGAGATTAVHPGAGGGSTGATPYTEAGGDT
ncbi:unnamed protein product, partial [Pylaiella littoralis]